MLANPRLKAVAKMLDAAIALSFLITYSSYYINHISEKTDQSNDDLKIDLATFIYSIALISTFYNTFNLLIAMYAYWNNMTKSQIGFASMAAAIGLCEFGYTISFMSDAEDKGKGLLAIGLSSAAITSLQRATTSYLGMFATHEDNDRFPILATDSRTIYTPKT